MKFLELVHTTANYYRKGESLYPRLDPGVTEWWKLGEALIWTEEGGRTDSIAKYMRVMDHPFTHVETAIVAATDCIIFQFQPLYIDQGFREQRSIAEVDFCEFGSSIFEDELSSLVRLFNSKRKDNAQTISLITVWQCEFNHYPFDDDERDTYYTLTGCISIQDNLLCVDEFLYL